MVKVSSAREVAASMAVERLADGSWANGRTTIRKATGLSDGAVARIVTAARKPWPRVGTHNPSHKAPVSPPREQGHTILMYEPAEVAFPSRDISPAPFTVEPVNAPSGKPVFDTLAEAFKDWIGQTVPAFAVCEPVCSPSDEEERICVISDIHAPWHNQAALVQACDEAEEEGCDTVYVCGDFFEYHRISRHHKSKTCTFEEEIAGCRLAAEYLASRFPRRYYFRGNHEDRWAKYVADNIGEELRFLVGDPTKMILDGLGYEFVGHQAAIDGDNKEMVWLAQVGEDAILTHCQLSSAQQGANLERLKLWLREWGQVLGFTSRPRFIQTGHTHRGTVHHEHDCLLVESGNLASLDIVNYQWKAPGGAQLVNRKPGVLGWTLLVQDRGRTDLKQSGFRRLAP